MRSLPHRGLSRAIRRSARATRRSTGPPEPRAGLPAPEELATLAGASGAPSPAGPAPGAGASRARAGRPPPRRLVARAQPRALPGGAGEDGELMPQQEVLGHQIALTAEARAEQNGEKEQVVEHRPVRMLPTRSKRPDRLLHPHRCEADAQGAAGRAALDGTSGRRWGERPPSPPWGPKPSSPGTAARVRRRARRSSGRNDPRLPRRSAPCATGCARWTGFCPPHSSSPSSSGSASRWRRSAPAPPPRPASCKGASA